MVISDGTVDAIRLPENGKTALVVGLIVVGAVLFIGAGVVSYLVYRKKNRKNDNKGE